MMSQKLELNCCGDTPRDVKLIIGSTRESRLLCDDSVLCDALESTVVLPCSRGKSLRNTKQVCILVVHTPCLRVLVVLGLACAKLGTEPTKSGQKSKRK